MDLAALKGEKKIQAILSLGNDPENGDFLLSLANSEKGKIKQAAMQALANFDYLPAIPLWQKLIKTKNKGENVFIKSTADSISDIVADEFYKFLLALFKQKDGYVLTEKEITNFKTYLSLMLGKASEKMRELYLLAAQNADKLSTFNFEANLKGLLINDYIHFYDPIPEDIKKIFPAVLSMSIVKGMDNRLVELAKELYATYKSNWLSPVFISELLSQPSENVFNTFSSYLKDENATYLYDTFGALYFDNETKRHIALLFWGQYKYGETDTRFVFTRPLYENLDERWFAFLTEKHIEKVTLQAYNRSGVLYESYDEMLAEIIPQPLYNENIKQQLQTYFIRREKEHNGFSELYLHAFKMLNGEINETMIERFINCKDNAVSKYSLKVVINKYTDWDNQRKLDFYKTLPTRLLLDEEIEKLNT